MRLPKTPACGILHSYSLKDNGKLNESQHYLYLYVAFRSNPSGLWNGTLGRLARMLDCPVITLRKRLEKLAKSQLVEWAGDRTGITISVKKTTSGGSAPGGSGGGHKTRKPKSKNSRKPIEVPEKLPLLDPALEVAASHNNPPGELFRHFIQAKRYAMDVLVEVDKLDKQEQLETFLVNGFDKDYGWDKGTINQFVRERL